MRQIYHDRGMSTNHHVSQTEFAKFIVSPDVACLVESVGVDVAMMVDIAPNMFEDLQKAGEFGMSFEKLVEMILDLRLTNPAKVKDMKENLKVVKLSVKLAFDNLQAVLEDV